MSEREPNPEIPKSLKDECLEGIEFLEKRSTAMETLNRYQGAIPFLELGIKLGRMDPIEAEELYSTEPLDVT